MELCLGIAGGHRHTDAALAIDRRIVAFTRGDSLNHHNFLPGECVKRLEQLLFDLVAKLNWSLRELLRKSPSIVVSLPGISTHVDQSFGEFLLRAAGVNNPTLVPVVDDTWTGLVGGLVQEQGICAFAGTGASVFFAHNGFQRGRPYKLDGYGAVIGDFGGGFRTAVRLIEKVERKFDADGTEHPLFQRLRTWPRASFDSPTGLQQWFDSLNTYAADGAWKQRIAELAQIVTDAAKNDSAPGHADAREILSHSAGQLAETIVIGLQRFEAARSLPVVCQGGMFRHSDFFFDEVRRLVQADFPSVRFKQGAYHPIVGALLIAQARVANQKPLEEDGSLDAILPPTPAIESILASAHEQGENTRHFVRTATAENLRGPDPS